MTTRLEQQIGFILEIDRLKHIYRRTFLLDKSRPENDAEHSWHIAVMALLLAEHANAPVDVSHVIKMLLIHDLVEIDAGDTYLYDEQATASKAAREQQAADRIFGLLPADQAQAYRALWDEFEAKHTPDAQFAAALDRLQPLLHNYYTAGLSWQKHGVTSDQVLARCAHIQDGSTVCWDYATQLIQHAVEKGYLAP